MDRLLDYINNSDRIQTQRRYKKISKVHYLLLEYRKIIQKEIITNKQRSVAYLLMKGQKYSK